MRKPGAAIAVVVVLGARLAGCGGSDAARVAETGGGGSFVGSCGASGLGGASGNAGLLAFGGSLGPGGSTGWGTAGTDDGPPWLRTDGRYLRDPSGEAPPLYGVSVPDLKVIADSRTIPGDASKSNLERYIDRATDASNGWYANVVRLPIMPEAFSDETGDHDGWAEVGADTYFTTYLDPAIQYCVQKRIYCIIDWHYIGADWSDPGVQSNTENFWTYVAPKYADVPNVLYEVLNEAGGQHNQADWESYKSVVDGWVSLIRDRAPDNLILVGGTFFSQNLTYVPQAPVDGTNIVYVAHIYAEHARSNWDSWFGNTADSYPVFVTEWGFQQGAPIPCDGTETSFGTAFKDYINGKDNIRWTEWNFDNIWYPLTWDDDWNLRTGPEYQGAFVKDWIAEMFQ